MKVRKPLAAVVGVLLAGIATGTMQYGHVSAQARGETKRREAVYLQTGYLVIGVSPDESRVVAYSTEVGGWHEYRAPQGTRLQPIMSEQVASLIVSGPAIKEVVAVSSRTGLWSRCPLKASVDGTVEPTVATQLVCCQVGDYIYAYSRLTGSWDVLQTKGKFQVHREKVVVHDGGRISVFSAKTGKWDSIDLRAL